MSQLLDWILYMLSWVPAGVSLLWSALTFLFQIPFFGFLIQAAFYALIGFALYRIYRWMPQRVRQATNKRVGPSLWFVTKLIRWPIGHWLMSLGQWLASDFPGRRESQPKPEKEIVRVPVRRTVRQRMRGFLLSGFFWVPVTFYVTFFVLR